jgi:hypothetical protein
MTTEELLKPRYKVMADWPGRSDDFKIGAIITLNKILDDELISKLLIPSRDKLKETPLYNAPCWIAENEMSIKGKGFFQLYPNLFKKLEWWEERKPQEMPEYVGYSRWIGIDGDMSEFNGEYDEIVRVKTHNLKAFDGSKFLDESNQIISYLVWWPATKEEYMELLNNEQNAQASVATGDDSSTSAK